MDLHQLEIFLAVVEHKSFSRAARAMHTTQSTVSFHVRALERALGTRLIDRGGRIVRATAAGRLLARYATRMVGMRDDALAQLSAQEQGDRGRVRIAASTIPAEYLLPPILARFHERYPQVEVAVEVLDSAGALDALLAESCDLALSGARRADRRIEYTAFAEDEVVLVTAARGRLMPPSGRAAAAWLREAPLIRREEGSGTRQAIDRLVARHGLSSCAQRAPMQVGSTEAQRRCVLAGLGLAFLSRHAVAEDLAAGRLRRVALAGTPVRRTFYLARLRGITQPACSRFLCSFIID
ncbi:MAG TPA: selenium metabolism-associated LysR family transcriptional regulator [Polyangia bacterium]|nr:selenium metabolism-associated LysR family transcriptional regulator [Polyangia bacterium]